MVDLPQRKVGIIACSGEELAEGTVSRLAALKVLEQLRPRECVTICLPLFLAGGAGDRMFARFFPTITVDGCELRCAARGTEKYSGKPAASLVVSDLIQEHGLGQVEGKRRLNAAGEQAVEVTAARIVELVDKFSGKRWNRREGEFVEADVSSETPAENAEKTQEATCACGSGVPVKIVSVNGRQVTLVALPLIFQQFYADGKMPGATTADALLAEIKIYNSVPSGEEPMLRWALLQEYIEYFQQQKTM